MNLDNGEILFNFSSWIRGIIDCHTGIATTRINTVFTRLQLHDDTTAIMCTVWEPICRPLSAIIKVI